MAKIFSASDFADSSTPEQAAPSKATFGADAFADSEPLPEYANGLYPDSAINESPVSIEDRAKLSVGNTAGKLKYLKENYGDAQMTKGGDFVVKDKKEGLWKRVDPEGLGDGDPWKMTKELVGDITEMVPTAANIGAQIAIGAATAPLIPVTGGASLAATAGIAGAAGAGLNALETSLGRLVGTYSGSVEDQAKDAAIEGLMSLGGTAVAAGVKPTMRMISNGLSKAGQKLADSPIRGFVADTLGMNVKGGAKTVERLFERGAQVASYMDDATKGGIGADDAINNLKVANIGDTKEIAGSIRPALTEFYDRGAKEVADRVPASFKVNFAEDTAPMLKAFVDKGMAEVDEAGKVTLKGFDQYVKDAQASGIVTDLINDKKSFDLMSDMFGEVQKYSGYGPQKGKVAAENLMRFRRNIFDKSFELQTAAEDAGLVPAQRFLAQLKGMGDEAVYSKFRLTEPVESALFGQTDNLFSSLNKQYAALSNQFKPLLRTVKAAETGGDTAYETLYNRLSSASGRNSIVKSEFDNAVDLVSKYSKSGNKMSLKYDAIRDRDSAMGFLPNFKPSLVSSTAMFGAASAAATGNIGVALPMAATAAITSPKVNYKVINGMLKASALVKGMKPAMREQLLKSPQALQDLYGTVLSRPQVEQQITSKLLQEAGKAITGQGQGQ